MAEILTLDVGSMSHGGHCIARHEGRVVFVRHAIPGETVRAVVTHGGTKARFWRADAVSVLARSDHRRGHPWKQADALRAYDLDQLPVGGAEYGHISDAHQRRLKGQVFRDTMSRVGNIDVTDLGLLPLSADGDLHVEDIGGTGPAGLHWRTRMSFGVAGSSLAMKPHRSHDLIPLRSMPLGVEAVRDSNIFSWDFSGARSVEVVAAAGVAPLTLIVRLADGQDPAELGARLVSQSASETQVGNVILSVPQIQRRRIQAAPRRRHYSQLQPTRTSYTTLVGSRTIREPLPTPVMTAEGSAQTDVVIRPEGFWQIHHRAPDALVSVVTEMADLPEGGSMIDLYAGAGLFTAWAAATVGPRGQVLSIEAAEASSQSATRLFEGMDHIETVCAPVERMASRLSTVDVILLDPPRAGADQRVLKGIDDADPGQILYVSCDPASFARDAGRLYSLGWGITDLRVLDMYPNTHHMESVAMFQRHANMS